MVSTTGNWMLKSCRGLEGRHIEHSKKPPSVSAPMHRPHACENRTPGEKSNAC